jgi:hypothetical protein
MRPVGRMRSNWALGMVAGLAHTIASPVAPFRR